MLISRIVVSAKLPLRVIRRIVNDVLAERTRQDLRRQRPSLDSAGAPAASAAAAGVLERGGPLQAARLVLRQEGALRALSLLRGYAHKPALAKFEGDEAMLTADGSLKPRLLAFYDNGVNTRPGSDSRGY